MKDLCRIRGQACRLDGQARLSDGQATLSFVLLVGGIIMEIAIAGSLIAFFSSGSGLGERLSARAFNTAQAGIRDAELKIVRNKELCSSCVYSFPVGSDTANVTVARADDIPNNAYVYTVTSLGTAANRQKKFVAVMSVDRTSGVVQLRTHLEQPVQ